MRYLNNYTLELCGGKDHPRYLSTLGLAMSLPPILLSPLVGGLIDWISFEVVFLIVIACVMFGWVLTFRIKEPREKEPLEA